MLQSPMTWEKDEIRDKEVKRAKKWKAMALSMTAGPKASRWKWAKSSEKLAEGAGGNWRFATKDPKVGLPSISLLEGVDICLGTGVIRC